MLPTSTESSLAYRGESESPDEREDAFRERMHPVFVLVWIASFARVAGAVVQREVLGAEATLALLTLVGLSWYAVAVLLRALEARNRRRRRPTE
jgi:membrane protein implicated in regulation of membrane protease activity